MRTSEVYGGGTASVVAARRSATAFLTRVGGERNGTAGWAEVTAAVQLVVSELVTNAVKHAGGQCGLDLELIGQTVEITVWDSSPDGVVAAEDPDPARVGRHGMEIVVALCGGFTVVPHPAGKKIVARMPLPATAG